MDAIELHSRFWGSLWPVFLFIIFPHGEVRSHYAPRLITGSEGREGVSKTYAFDNKREEVAMGRRYEPKEI